MLMSRNIRGRHSSCLLILLLCVCLSTLANTEVYNFGPLLCDPAPSASESNDPDSPHPDVAAQRLSEGWPSLDLSTAPSLFTLRSAVSISGKDAHLEGRSLSSQDGAWLVLHLRGSHDAGPELPASLTSWAEAFEAYLSSILSFLTHSTFPPWSFTERYHLRISWAANFPVDVSVDLHTPRSMLALGGVEWRKRLLADGLPLTEPPTAAPTGAATAVATGPSPPLESTGVWSEYTAIQALVPCSIVYAHVTALSHGVRIPPSSQTELQSSFGTAGTSLLKMADRLAAFLFDPLTVAPSAVEDVEANEAPGFPVPIHATLECLHLGFVPTIAVNLLPTLFVTLAFAYWVLAPWLQSAVLSLTSERPVSL